MTDPDFETTGRTFLAKIDRLIANGRIAEFKYVLTTHPLLDEIESPPDDLLVHAIEHGKASLARICLEVGARVDGQGDGFPPLSYALEQADDDLSMLQLLLECHADPNVRMLNDYTPLHIAAQENKLLAAKELILAGANVDAETRIDDYFTPAMEASSRGHTEMLRLLLNAGADAAQRNRCGQSIVDVAATNCRDRIARTLKESGRR